MKKKQLFDTRRKVPFSPIVDKDAICDSDGNPLDALYATKKEVAAKQDTLKAGKGIIIKGGVISSTVDRLITPITYAELVALRNSASLVAGMQYRITDYDFTTTETDTASAHQLFDIIVTADSESVLNESARAVHHRGSLSSRDIAAWELKYTLKNTKHSSPDGKGTVLWMKDEFQNECNYDFINALFMVYEITACAKSPDLVGTYAIKTNNSVITYGNNSKLVPTFGSKNNNNIIKYDGLAKIVFGKYCSSNTFSYNCHSNTFGNNCSFNTFSYNCYYNTFRDLCSFNTFEENCESNTFGDSCSSNTFSYNCYSNTFGKSCSSNTFSGNCHSNTFGKSCSSNAFGNDCFGNAFGGNCKYNTFGNNFYSNTFGDLCSFNTFGKNCKSNTFGSYCRYNTFGNDCEYIKFASSISATTKYNYYKYNHFGDGCQNIVFTGAETASSTAQVQNYNFAQGLQGTPSAYIEIDGVRSRAYETKVAKNSSGELKIYCEADLIQ